jgi:hypothetical protein
VLLLCDVKKFSRSVGGVKRDSKEEELPEVL